MGPPGPEFPGPAEQGAAQVSGTTVEPAAHARAGRATALPWLAGVWRDPVAAAIAVATLAALGLRFYQLARPGYLTGLTEYDDGPYFGSAVRLVSGQLPYRAFIFVQPPGITLLMAPAALVAKAVGTAAGMAIGRVLTTLASAAGVVLAGLLVRHRGPVATLVACGVLATYPDAVSAAHTVLVEPWLVLLCLLGALAVFDRGRLAAGRRLIWGGLAFGFAGAVEAWAILPVLVVAALCLLPGAGAARDRWRRAGAFAAGVTLGFGVPVLPFALAGPRQFYQSLIVAQVGPRAAVTRIPLWARFKEMAGLSDTHLPGRVYLGFTRVYVTEHLAVTAAVVAIAALAIALPALRTLASRWRPAPLDGFAVVTMLLVVAVFCWPSQFHYHFSAFLAPFLALAVALPLGGQAAPGDVAPAGAGRGTGRWLPGVLAGLAAAVLAAFTVFQARAEAQLQPLVAPATIATARQAIPAGSCVATDEVSLLLLADRFTSAVPGCSPVLDGLGTDLALSGGRKPSTGAGRAPAVAAVWQAAFTHAQFAWLSRYNARRIAWTPALRAYFRGHFTRVLADSRGDALYRRTG
jgi:alpha-1,2-mannosyltransferase